MYWMNKKGYFRNTTTTHYEGVIKCFEGYCIVKKRASVKALLTQGWERVEEKDVPSFALDQFGVSKIANIERPEIINMHYDDTPISSDEIEILQDNVGDLDEQDEYQKISKIDERDIIFSISILCCNRIDQTKKCLNSILNSKGDIRYELILTDNNSQDDTYEYIQSFKEENDIKTIIIKHKKNIGFIGGQKYAFKKANGRYFLMLNNDITVSDYWLDKILSGFSDHDVKICGPTKCRLLDNGKGYSVDSDNYDYIEGSCLAIEKEYAEEFGLFSPELEFAYAEDSDLCLCARMRGFKIKHTPFNMIHDKSCPTSRLVREDVRGYNLKNEKILVDKFSNYIKNKSFKKSYLIKRTSSSGDVFLITPLIKQIKRENVYAEITIVTNAPGLLVNNPKIDNILGTSSKINESKYDCVIDLDMTYECMYHKSESIGHIVDSYMAQSGIHLKDKRPEFFLTDKIAEWVEKYFNFKYIVVHLGPNPWDGRNMPIDVAKESLLEIKKMGYRIIEIGKSRNLTQDIADSYCGLSWEESAGIIKNCSGFFGIDSAPMHIANAYYKPGAVILGSVPPELVLLYPERLKAIRNENLNCLGCRIWSIDRPMNRKLKCPRGNDICVKSITSKDVLRVFKTVVPSLQKISIIVPTYNREKPLLSALESIKKQTYENYEVIVVNDGGDDVRNIIKDSELENYIYVRHSNNLGLFASLNTGLKLATGDFVTELDDDDLFRPNALELLISGFTNNGIKAVYGKANRNFNYRCGDIIPEENYTLANMVKRGESPLETGRNWTTCNRMFRKEIFDDIGYFDDTLPCLGDMEMNFRVLDEYGVDAWNFIDKIVVDVNISQKSMTYSTELDGTRKMIGEKIIKKYSKKNCKNILLTTASAPIQNDIYFSISEKLFPIGLGYIASILREEGHNIFFKDPYYGPADSYDSEYLESNDIDIVGIYACTICIKDVMNQVRKLKSQKHNVKIISGGPHWSVTEDYPDEIDHIIIGEAENVILDLISGKIKDHVIKTKYIKELDGLPMPAYDLIGDRKYKSHVKSKLPFFNMNTSRGCPYNCSFCSSGPISGNKYRFQSAERIIKDIEYLKAEKGVGSIYFRENNFCFNNERIYNFCNLLKQNNIDIDWYCETSVRDLSPELLDKMQGAGCKGLFIGFETGSERLLPLLKPGFKMEDNIKIAKYCKGIGMNMHASFLFGTPYETEQDRIETENFIDKYIPKGQVSRNVYIGLPGSKIYNELAKNNDYEFKDEYNIIYTKGHDDKIRKYFKDSHPNLFVRNKK